MDFGVVGLNNFGFSNSRNGSSASENGAEYSKKQKMYGSGNPKQERTIINEEDELTREFKVAKTSSSLTSSMMKIGYGYGGLNSSSIHGLRGPFTASQWMELEHQALIYKYITANVPIPSYLLNPIAKAFHSSAFSTFSGLRPNALGWGGFHVGLSNTDPEPGRCRRTDGKKWRCSRDAVVDQKYCERHLNRGRNRSRKPVEVEVEVEVEPPHSTNTNAKLPPMASSTSASAGGGVSNNLDLLHSHKLTNLQTASGTPNMNRSLVDKENTKDKQYSVSKQHNAYEESCGQEFGLVCSDSLLNPLNRSPSFINFRNYCNTTHNLNDHETKLQHALRQFMDNTELSISIPTCGSSPLRLSREIEETQMGLGVGPISSWEPSMGGPLGEVLHTTNEWKNGKEALNFMEKWNNSLSSPTRVLQRGAFGSLSNSSAGSGPRADGVSLCSGALMNHPSLPAL